jgi:NAD(P)-dependent dehydrogenase (short-subunit alcohol dehydrogenase family)
MIARAIAAQVIWIGHPSGTVSSRVALFLASDQPAWVTGERISVSGGER